NRLSDEPIRSHSGIKSPKIVVVLDASLIEPAKVTAGLKEDGILLVNTTEPAEELKKRLGLPASVRVYTVDASKIAVEEIGKDVPNTPMLGALVKVTGLFELEPMMEAIRHKLETKFRGREKLIETNLKSIRRAFQEVRQ
ncbi:MAG: 2-oxoacid:acceptor oxidoreductase family protein, partial [candidate division WOR-3 bacterium]